MVKIDKLSPDKKADLAFDLINSFKYLNNTSDIANFLEDLLTASEVRNLSVRLRIAKLLLNGKSQREIASERFSNQLIPNGSMLFHVTNFFCKRKSRCKIAEQIHISLRYRYNRPIDRRMVKVGIFQIPRIRKSVNLID